MGKWYNKIFVGNPNKEDFTAKDLPKTRFEQYFDVVKLRFGSMVLGNVMYMLFALPLLLFALYFWFALSQMQTGDVINALTGENSSVLISFLLVCIPLYTIMGPGKAGLYYCLRNWAWNERATIKEHFWHEFKRSFWKALFLNFINAAALFAGVWWISFLLMNAGNYPVMRVFAVIITILLAVYFMSSIYHFPQLVTYNLKIRQILKNSFIYTIVQFPRTLLMTLCYCAVALLCYFLSQILLVIMLFMGMSFVYLAQMIFSNYLFDRYVNAPQDRRKGMAPLE